MKVFPHWRMPIITSGKWLGFAFHSINLSDILRLNILLPYYFSCAKIQNSNESAKSFVIFLTTFYEITVIFQTTFRHKITFFKRNFQINHLKSAFLPEVPGLDVVVETDTAGAMKFAIFFLKKTIFFRKHFRYLLKVCTFASL